MAALSFDDLIDPTETLSEDQATDAVMNFAPGAQITSGYRTPEHNAEVKGVPNSLHTRGEGQAQDIVLPPHITPDQFRSRLTQAGYPVTEFLVEKAGDPHSTGAHVHWGWGPKGAAAPAAASAPSSGPLSFDDILSAPAPKPVAQAAPLPTTDFMYPVGADDQAPPKTAISPATASIMKPWTDLWTKGAVPASKEALATLQQDVTANPDTMGVGPGFNDLLLAGKTAWDAQNYLFSPIFGAVHQAGAQAVPARFPEAREAVGAGMEGAIMPLMGGTHGEPKPVMPKEIEYSPVKTLNDIAQGKPPEAEVPSNKIAETSPSSVPPTPSKPATAVLPRVAEPAPKPSAPLTFDDIAPAQDESPWQPPSDKSGDEMFEDGLNELGLPYRKMGGAGQSQKYEVYTPTGAMDEYDNPVPETKKFIINKDPDHPSWHTAIDSLQGYKPEPPTRAPEPVAAKPTAPEAPSVPKRPTDLLQFIANRGGLRADQTAYGQGDLQAMEAHKWHIGKPFQKRIVQAPGKGGLTLHNIRESARDAGYGHQYNDFETEDDVLQAIGDSIRGNDIFPEGVRGGAEDAQAWRDFRNTKFGPNEDYYAPPDHEFEPTEAGADKFEHDADLHLALTDPYAWEQLHKEDAHVASPETGPQPQEAEDIHGRGEDTGPVSAREGPMEEARPGPVESGTGEAEGRPSVGAKYQKQPNLDFQQHIARLRQRRADVESALKGLIGSKGRAVAERTDRPSYRIMLSRGVGSDAPFRVTSFDGDMPTGHRDYNSIEDAAQEFLSNDMAIKGATKAQKPKDLFATEPGAVDARGKALPQTIIPGAEASAVQLAKAREAQGHGLKSTKAAQKDAGPLFGGTGASKDQGTLFQKSEPRTVRNTGVGTEHVKLADDLVGKTIGRTSPEEARLINAVEAEAEKIVPSAKVGAYRKLLMGDAMSKQAGISALDRITGATYTNGLKQIIAWSLESPDAIGTLRHEALHYLYGRGLITGPEWKALNREAIKGGWEKKYDIANRYPEADAAVRREEAIAEHVNEWRKASSSVPKMFAPMMTRVSRFVARIADHARRIVGKDVTADDVLSRIHSGEIGRRDTGELNARQEPRFQRGSEDPEDAVTDAMAADARSKGPGTYARFAANKLNDEWAEGKTKHVNGAEAKTILPQTLASMDWRSAKYYGAVKARDAFVGAAKTTWAEMLKPFSKLSHASQDKVLAGLELLRLDNRNLADDGEPLELENSNYPLAELSKPGDTLRFTPAETEALHAVKSMFAKQWRDLMKATAVKFGWKGDPSPEAIRQFAETTQQGPAGKRSLGRIADIMQAMAESERQGYVPLMRRGDYYLAVKRKPQPGDDSLGGFPPVDYFRRVESKGTLENIFGRPSFMGEKGTPATAFDAVEDLNRNDSLGHFEYDPKTKTWESETHDIEHGYLSRSPDALRSLSVPAIEKLMYALEHRSETGERGFSKNPAFKAMMDEVRTQLYEDLKAGFKKKAKNVPGYDPDFRRSISSYSNWLGEHTGDLTYGDEIERGQNTLANHPDPRVRNFWTTWDAAQDARSTLSSRLMQKLGNLAFYYAIGGVPASAASVFLHGPTVGTAALASGAGVGASIDAMSRALSRAATLGMKVGVDGFEAGDVARVGKSPAEKAFLRQRAKEGAFHSGLTADMGALKAPNGLSGKAKSGFKHALNAVGSTIGGADALNRLAITHAAYEMASDPKTFARIMKNWGRNESFKDFVRRYGKTPEAVARFALDDAAFDYGKRNTPALARNMVGKLYFQFHNFVYRAMSKQAELLYRRGPQGHKALAMMLVGIGALAGAQGEDFVIDAEKLYDFLRNKYAKPGSDVARDMETWLAKKMGPTGAKAVMHGPIATALGVNLTSRLGFGDVISREFQNIPVTKNGLELPLPPGVSIPLNAGTHAYQRYKSGQGATSAATELLPNFLKRPAQAVAVWPKRGVLPYDTHPKKGTYGIQHAKPIVPAGHISLADQIRYGLGYEPQTVSEAYDARNADYLKRHSGKRGLYP